MKKKQHLPTNSVKDSDKVLTLPLPSYKNLPKLKHASINTPIDASEEGQVRDLTDKVMADLKQIKSEHGEKAELNRLESLALSEVLNYRKGPSTYSPAVKIYEQDRVDNSALPELLKDACELETVKNEEAIFQPEAIENALETANFRADSEVFTDVNGEKKIEANVSSELKAKEAKLDVNSEAKIEEHNENKSLETATNASKLKAEPSLPKVKPLIQLAFDTSLATKLKPGVKPTVVKTLDENELAAYIDDKAQAEDRHIFKKPEAKDLLFSYNKQPNRCPKQHRKLWQRAIMNLFQEWRKLLLPRVQAGDWQEKALASKAKQFRTSANLASTYLFVTTICMLLSHSLWALLPGSFLTVYKTQVSGYVLRTLYRDLTCFILPAYWVYRRYKLHKPFVERLVGQSVKIRTVYVILPLIAISLACLLTATNRLLVMHIFAPWHQEILEAPFLLLNASNPQASILLFVCSVLVASVLEAVCICGLYLTALKVHFQAKSASILCAMAWMLLYVSEVDFVSLFILAFVLASFKQICDNIYVVISLNIMVKIGLLVERAILPSMVSRNSNSFSSGQAMAVVDILLIVVSAGLIYYLCQLCKKVNSTENEPNKKANIYKQAAKLIVRWRHENWPKQLDEAVRIWPLVLGYFLLIVNYAIYWYLY